MCDGGIKPLNKLKVRAVKDPTRFGVVEFGKNNEVISIEEKPKNPKSNFAQTGLYFYDSSVFKILKNIEPSDRGELEVTDLNNYYLGSGSLTCELVKGFWGDAGVPDSLFTASQFARNKLKNK